MYYLWIDYEYITVNELWILCIDYVSNMNKLWTNQNRNNYYYPMHEPRERSFTYNCIKSINNLKILSYFTIFKLSILFRIFHLRSISCYPVSWSYPESPDKILVSSQNFFVLCTAPCFLTLSKKSNNNKTWLFYTSHIFAIF